MDLNQIDTFFKNQMGLAEKAKIRNNLKPIPRPARNLAQERLRWQMETMKLNELNTPPGNISVLSTLITGEIPSCKTSLEKLKPITLKEMEVPKVHKGRYLVCKSIVTPICMVSTNILIQDLNGDIEDVSFYNFCYNFRNPDWLKIGTIMIIKEPYLRFGALTTNASMRIDSPSDVIFVDPTDLTFLKRIGAEKWFQSATKDVDEIRKAGNDCFMNKKYDDALRLYDRAIRYQPELAVLYLNKASTCLRTGHFYLAYQAAKTGLEKGADREKALHRLGLAAYGMRNWKLATGHFEMLFKEFPKNSEAVKELKRSKQRIEEAQTGKFDFNQMYLDDKKGKREFDIADYTLPSIEVKQIPGKGRGIVAKEDIPKGTLLLVSKAFAAGYQEDVPAFVIAVNLIQKQADNTAAKLQIIKAIDNLRKNPQKASELYALYAGDSIKKEEIPEGVIDSGLIEKISVHNRFGDYTIKMSGKKEEPFSMNEKATLLYILPSYFNHACFANSYRTFYGDVMAIHATTNIKKGDEISLSYIYSLDPYSERKDKLLKGWGFVCKCRLCEIDKVDVNHEKRAILLKKLQEVVKQTPQQALIKGKVILKQIRDSYVNKNDLKIVLAQALIVISHIHQQLGNPTSSIECLEEVVKLVPDELELVMYVPHVLCSTASCYSALGNLNKARGVVNKAFKISFCSDKEHFKNMHPEIQGFF